MIIASVRPGPVGPADAEAAARRADRAQAQLLLGVLEREFEQVTARINFAEHCAADEQRHGFAVSAQRFEDEACRLWVTLGELHRMIAALRARQTRP
ncbi:hypothetical protein ACWEQV_12155 [Rhodococcus aetherivorans]